MFAQHYLCQYLSIFSKETYFTRHKIVAISFKRSVLSGFYVLLSDWQGHEIFGYDDEVI